MKWVKLGEVCELNPKKRLSSGLEPTTEVSFVPMAAVSEEGEVKLNETRKIEEVQKGYTFFEDDDILFAKITPCMENGKGGIARGLKNGIGFGSTEFHVIRPKEGVDPDYINFLLRSSFIRKEAELNMTGSAGQKRVQTDYLKSVTIPLPPLSEQRRIAEVLDGADALRRLDRELVGRYDALIQSVFYDMFGDLMEANITQISKIAKDERGSFSNGPFGSDLLSSELTESGVPVIYIRDIRNGVFHWKSNVFVSETKAESLPACQIGFNDILVAKVGDPPGIAAIYNSKERAIMTQDVIRIRLNDSVQPQYVKHWINSHFGRIEIEKITIQGTRMRFSLGDFKKISIPLPPLSLQQRFAEVVQGIESQKAIAEAGLRRSEELMGSLMAEVWG
jgi:type I restriction enzyme S subunit